MSQPVIIFLDFDGVLHACTAGTFTKLAEFEAFLRQYLEVLVVFTTSWRLDYAFAELAEYFSADLRPRFIGVTGELPDNTPAQRYQEILQWRRDHNALQSLWVAVDDSAELFPPGCPELVLCATIRGLRPAQFTAIREKLTLTHVALPMT